MSDDKNNRYDAAIRGDADEPTADEVVDGLRAEVERLRVDNKWLLEQAKQSEGVRADQAKQLRTLRAENAELREMYRNTERDLQAQNRATEAFERQAEEAERQNAELGKKLECKRVRIEAMQANWSAERERTEADRQSADKLRANIAETQLVGAMEELDWFRRRDELVDRVKAATNLHAEALAVLALIEWEEKNPKPGAGT